MKKHKDILEGISCYFFDNDSKLIFSKLRHKKIKDAQKIGIFILREIYNLTYEDIAKHFTCNHGTIMYHHKTYCFHLKYVKYLKRELEAVVDYLGLKNDIVKNYLDGKL